MTTLCATNSFITVLSLYLRLGSDFYQCSGHENFGSNRKESKNALFLIRTAYLQKAGHLSIVVTRFRTRRFRTSSKQWNWLSVTSSHNLRIHIIRNELNNTDGLARVCFRHRFTCINAQCCWNAFEISMSFMVSMLEKSSPTSMNILGRAASMSSPIVNETISPISTNDV